MSVQYIYRRHFTISSISVCDVDTIDFTTFFGGLTLDSKTFHYWHKKKTPVAGESQLLNNVLKNLAIL